MNTQVKIIFGLLLIFLFASGYRQHSDKQIIGKWHCNKRDFVDQNNKTKIIKSQNLPYKILYEFKSDNYGSDNTVEGHLSEFKYSIHKDTLFYGKLIATIDLLTKDKLTITELWSDKKPKIRYYFTRTK